MTTTRICACTLVCLSMVLQLSGCTYFDSPLALHTWQHPTKSAGDFQLDEEYCQSQVQAFADHLEEAHNPFNRIHRVNDCLRIKGYTEKR
jgi:hypothetical protein